MIQHQISLTLQSSIQKGSKGEISDTIRDELAREFGIVIGSRKEDDGSIWIQENTRQWFPFEEFSSKWTLEYLRLKKMK
ncbi:MAG: hypothetical protein ACYT04_56235 [Nostoc sp.]